MPSLTFTLDTAYDASGVYTIRKVSDNSLVTTSGGSYTIDSYDKLAYIAMNNLTWSQPWKIEITILEQETSMVNPTVYFSIGQVFSNTTYGGVSCHRLGGEDYARLDDTPLSPDNSRVATYYTCYNQTRTYSVMNHPLYGISMSIGGALVSARPVGSTRDIDTRGLVLYLGTTGGFNCKSGYQSWTNLDWSKIRVDHVAVYNPLTSVPRLISVGVAHHRYWRLRMRCAERGAILKECMIDDVYRQDTPPSLTCSISHSETLNGTSSAALNVLNNPSSSSSVQILAPAGTSGLSSNYWTTLTYDFGTGRLPGQIRILEVAGTTHVPQTVQVFFSINNIDWFFDDEFTIPSDRWNGQMQYYSRDGNGWTYWHSV